jgi:hypothetical protein
VILGPVTTPLDLVAAVRSADRAAAYERLMAWTAEPVDWAYTVWDELVDALGDENNHVRSIASQVLCALAKSDPEHRIVRDLDRLLAVTTDPKFVTARHCLQALWQVGVVEAARPAYLAAMEARFTGCRGEKNWSLVRYDVVVGLDRVHAATGDAAVRALAQELVDSEDDPKYRKKYATALR